MRMRSAFTGLGLILVLSHLPVAAQSLSLPPSGDNQQATVSQRIGLVEIRISYSSPKVTAPDGTDRKGKIWGELVPYGMANLGFGTCGSECPWRAGANENTVFSTSHAVKVEGKDLPAGTYGLHMIPGRDEWTVIFSKNSTSWGSYFYDAKEDALRVQVKPQKSEYRHWLTYEFTERTPAKATVALAWENLAVPFTIVVENPDQIYLAEIRKELRSSSGFTYRGWEQAAEFCLQKKTNLAEGLKWAETAVSGPGIGREMFSTLRTLSQLQAANGQTAEAQKSMQRAVEHPTAGPIDLHMYGRQLQGEGKKEEALKVFELNAKKHPNAWPVNVGLARGYAGVGKKKDALKFARLALPQAPDDLNKKSIQRMIEQLEAGKDI
ncbi:MAG: DUF2911 domain-containing protein [Acidobacteria bacterium]|nr:DUF2911 domain-containing protein [Acidobacteriota bacterium]